MAALQLFACRPLYADEPWGFPGAHWDQSRAPEDFGMLRSKLDEFKANLGTESSGCIIKNGFLIYQWGNISANKDWASASKPCLSTLLFAAIDEGRIENPDSPIQPYWPELRPIDSTMTFRHLADMMSGYACDDEDEDNSPLPPGSRWAYNDYAIMLYVKTLDKVFETTDNLVTAGTQRFVIPLQFEDGVLFDDAKGRVQSSARDFARMGWFWLNKGNWDGVQLLPSRFFEDFMKADVPFEFPRSSEVSADDYLGVGTYGGGVNQHHGQGSYGFNWWFNRCLTVPPRNPPLIVWPSAPADVFIASGHWGKEVLLMMPSYGIVVAAYNGQTATWGDIIVTDPPDSNSTLNQNLRVLVESVQPRFVEFSMSDSDLEISGYGGLPGTDYVVLLSTNVGTTKANWTPILTNQFDLNGKFSVARSNLLEASETYYRLFIP